MLGERNTKSWNSCGSSLIFCIHFPFTLLVEGLCCKAKYRANITRFIFVFSLYCFYQSSCLKDQFTVLSLYVLRYSSRASPFSAPFWIIELLLFMSSWYAQMEVAQLVKIGGAMRPCITLVPIKVNNMVQLCQKHRVIWVRQMNELWSFRSKFYCWAGDSSS